MFPSYLALAPCHTLPNLTPSLVTAPTSHSERAVAPDAAPGTPFGLPLSTFHVHPFPNFFSFRSGHHMEQAASCRRSARLGHGGDVAEMPGGCRCGWTWAPHTPGTPTPSSLFLDRICASISAGVRMRELIEAWYSADNGDNGDSSVGTHFQYKSFTALLSVKTLSMRATHNAF